jgi:hypothetical protein
MWTSQAEEEEPENSREHEHDQRHHRPALQELPRPGMKKLASAAMTFPVDP